MSRHREAGDRDQEMMEVTNPRASRTILILITVSFLSLDAQAKYGGGSGTAEDPYQIWTAEQMNAIGADPCDWDKHFVLMADIDLSDYDGQDGRPAFNIIAPEPDETGYSRRTAFAGVFDGNGHMISNFNYASADMSCVGVFGWVDWWPGRKPEIRNLGLLSPSVDAGSGDNVGSLVGRLTYGMVSNCYAEGGSVSGGDSVGGLVGGSTGTISNCYATSRVSGNERVGGLVGESVARGTIVNCYATGSLSGNEKVGGLVGDQDWGTTVLSFWDMQTTGIDSSAGGDGKTTAQMQNSSTFLGWGTCGNEGTWTIDEGNDYPRLAWQNMPGVSMVTSEPGYGGGSGSADDPFLIYTAEQLNTIGLTACHWDKHFILMADIDLSQYRGNEFNTIGVSWKHPFLGVFDGNGRTISNFTYISRNRHHIGIFGCVGSLLADRGVIKHLRLVGAEVDAGTGECVGSLAGSLFGGTICNCHVEGASVAADVCVGGLVGENWGTIARCSVTATISGNAGVGGLVGDNAGTTTGCYSAGNVEAAEIVGGLAGRNMGGDRFPGTIINSYSTASVAGGDCVGGLVGSHWDTIANCYSTGRVEGGENLGGLVGSNVSWSGVIADCYWDTRTSGLSNMCGNGTDCDDSHGRTTAEMKRQATFSQWDFTEVWGMAEGQTYPFLRRHLLGDLNQDYRIDVLDLALLAGNWLASAR
ncbi:MAG: hypothetical protein JSU70_12050 [Phycisphaerales bacterium]|nr:MAG: hypothetical protein JSU70_12050 [Phycisphaerales bacterium]